MVNTVSGGNSTSSSSGDSDGASVSTRSSLDDQGILADHPAFHPPMRATDLDGIGSGLSISRAASTFVTSVQKQAPEGLAVDKQGRILVNGPNF